MIDKYPKLKNSSLSLNFIKYYLLVVEKNRSKSYAVKQ